MPGIRGMKRGGHAPHLQRILDELTVRPQGMTVKEMADLVERDHRSLQGSLAQMRVLGELVPERREGRWVVYVRGRKRAYGAPRPLEKARVALDGDRPTMVDDAQVRAVFATFARWGRRSAGAA